MKKIKVLAFCSRPGNCWDWSLMDSKQDQWNIIQCAKTIEGRGVKPTELRILDELTKLIPDFQFCLARESKDIP